MAEIDVSSKIFIDFLKKCFLARCKIRKND